MFPYSLHIAFADLHGSVDLFDITFDFTVSRKDIYYIIEEIRNRILCPFEKTRNLSPHLFSFLSFLTLLPFKSYKVAINPMFNISTISAISTISNISNLDMSFQDWFPKDLNVNMMVSVRKDGERIISVPILGKAMTPRGDGDNNNNNGNNDENNNDENEGDDMDIDNNEAYNNDRIRYITKLIFF